MARRTPDGVTQPACLRRFEDKPKGKLVSPWVVNIRSLLTPSDRLAGTFQGSRRVQRNLWRTTLQPAREKALDLVGGGGLRGGYLAHPSAPPEGSCHPLRHSQRFFVLFTRRGVPVLTGVFDDPPWVRCNVLSSPRKNSTALRNQIAGSPAFPPQSQF